MVKVKPRNNWVYVRLLDLDEKREADRRIIHEKPDEAKLNKELIRGHVVAVGPKVRDVTEGNTVLLPGTYVTRRSAGHVFIQETEIEAVAV